MTEDKPSARRVVMARRLAATWLEDRVNPEYRMEVLTVGASRDRRALPSLLRSYRDDKIRLAGGDTLLPLPDLGVREGFDQFVVWSKDRAGLVKLGKWLESKGYETSGVW